jgi:hypothetical protein
MNSDALRRKSRERKTNQRARLTGEIFREKGEAKLSSKSEDIGGQNRCTHSVLACSMSASRALTDSWNLRMDEFGSPSSDLLLLLLYERGAARGGSREAIEPYLNLVVDRPVGCSIGVGVD